jgi:integrase
MASDAYLDRVGRWSESTKVGYGIGCRLFAQCFGSPQDLDFLVARIRKGELDVYECLERYISNLAGKGLAPKTIRFYLTAVRGLLRHEGVVVDDYQVRSRVGVPPNVESSIDRIPTKEEMRLLVLDTNPRTRALIALLATSGLRIGEAANLRIGNLDLMKGRVTVVATRSKSRRTRVTFMSDEAVKLMRDYLRNRVDKKDEWVFPDAYNPLENAGRNGLYSLIYRVLVKLGLHEKLDPDSRMYELHPHAFRKYFFSKLIGAGVDRGVAEYFMGHRFGLDNAYLRMDEERLRKEYNKAADDFTFLQDRKLDRESKERVDELQNLLKRKDSELASTNERLARLEGLWESVLEKKITNGN